MPTNEEIASALRKLVKLHRHWFRGTAYVSVAFEHENDAAIAEANRILGELGEVTMNKQTVYDCTHVRTMQFTVTEFGRWYDGHADYREVRSIEEVPPQWRDAYQASPNGNCFLVQD